MRKLHDYQWAAVEFILDHPEAALFLDMGLGKTISTLTAIEQLIYDRFESEKVLVVAPKRVAELVWAEEAASWPHTSHLRVNKVVGTPKQREAALNAPGDIWVIGRDNLAWLVQNFKFDFDTLVLDELSSFKSHRATRTKAVAAVRGNVNRVIGLTGTPAPKSLMDLWSQFYLLDQGERLGKRIGHYRTNYFRPDKTNGHVVYSYKLLPGAAERIYGRIEDITISMGAVDHLDLPEKVVQNIEVELPPKAKRLYQELKKEFFAELAPGGVVDASNAAVLANKLLQLASGAVYDPGGHPLEVHSAKLDPLGEALEGANGQPTLVAYWFQHERDRISKRFPDAVELKKPNDFKRWNGGDISVGLIHPASAGHGLNLQQGGSRLIWFGPIWDLEAYQQTNARLHRQGQKNRVTIQHLIAKGTIDTHVMKILRDKKATQADLIEAAKRF